MIPNLRQGIPQPANLNLDNYTKRLDSLNKDDLKALSECPGLKEFLGQANEYLREHSGEAESIAHYLMGKVDSSYLSDELRGTKLKLDLRIQGLLKELLKVHTWGWLGKKEASDKTREKIQMLEARLETSWSSRLEQWSDSAEDDAQKQIRDDAILQLCVLQLRHGRTWNFRGRGFTSIPPIEAHVDQLDLRNNAIERISEDLLNRTGLEIDLRGNPLTVETIQAIVGSHEGANILYDQR